MTHIKIYHNDLADTKVILASTFSITGNRNNMHKPNANIDGPTEVHTQSFENLKYAITGIHFVPSSKTAQTNIFTWDDLLKIYRSSYDGTNPIQLEVIYGSSISEQTVTTYTSEGTSTTELKCVLESFSFPIDVNNSKDAYLPTGTMNLRETK